MSVQRRARAHLSLFSACCSAAAATKPSRSHGEGREGRPYTGYPDSMVVLAHSGATGESSGGAPGVEVRENSWATGTNPAVNSVYQRLLELNPAIEGNAENLASGGATVQDLVSQAQRGRSTGSRATAGAHPDHGQRHRLSCVHGGLRLVRVHLRVSPGRAREGSARVEVPGGQPVRQPVDVREGADARPAPQAGGTGPCAFIDPDGRLVQRELTRIATIIDAYEAKLAEGCQKVDQCTYDDGAFGSIVDRPEYIASDLNHATVAGHAKAAEVAWTTLQRAGLVPAGD